MAVTVSGTPTSSGTDTISSVTFAHNATGDGLFVGGGNQGNKTFSSCTFNGVAMTELWDAADNDGVQRGTGYLLCAPAAGSHNVVLTAAATCDLLWAAAVGLSGLASPEASAHRTVYTNIGPTGNPSVTVVDSTSGDLVIDCAVTLSGTIAVGAGQTSQAEVDGIAGGSTSAGVSTESASGASTVMSWTGGSGGTWIIGATALVASGGGSTGWGPLLGFSRNRIIAG